MYDICLAIDSIIEYEQGWEMGKFELRTLKVVFFFHNNY